MASNFAPSVRHKYRGWRDQLVPDPGILVLVELAPRLARARRTWLDVPLHDLLRGNATMWFRRLRPDRLP